MKLMKKLMKKNNKGMSLVELICAIAILGLTTTALGGAMVISAQHYQRDSAEFNVQQEAQTATNLIGNLVVDAAEVEWSGNTLTITADGKEHKIYQEGTTLKYNHDGKEGVLAEGVAPGGFTAKINKEDATKTNADNVNISLKLVDGQSEYVSNYNATPRNGELSQGKFADKVCVISIEDEVVIEPNQTFEMKVDVLGMDMFEVGGLTVSNVPTGWNIEYENNKIKMEAPYGASGDFKFLVQTVNNKPNSTDKWAQKEVQVRVRRVNAIDLTLDNVVGTEYANGTVYEFKTSINGTNLSKGYGRSYDLAPYEYIDPKQVSYTVSTTGGTPVTVTSESSDGCKVRLDSDLGYNESLIVTAVALHPSNVNKATVKNGVNTPYGIVIDTETLTNPNPPAPPQASFPPSVTFPEGIQRGMDFNWNSKLNESINKSDLENKYNTVVSPHWYIRYTDENGVSTQYYPTVDDGSSKKFHGNNETLVMLPNLGYTIEMIYVFLDSNNNIVWPHDSNLLKDGLGFKEAGVGQGWSDSDPEANIKNFNQYGGSHKIPAAELYYVNTKYETNDNYPGVAEEGQVKTVDLTLSFSGQNGNPKQFKANYDILHLYKAASSADGTDQNDKNFSYEYTIWKKDANGKWAPLDSETSALLRFEKDNSGTNGSFSVWDINDKVQGNDVEKAEKREKLKGEYRVGVDLKMYCYKYADSASVFSHDFEYEKKTFPMYDISKDNTVDEIKDGFFYFEIVD